MKKIEYYTRNSISITAWDWVSVNAKISDFANQEWFKKRNGMSFENFTKTKNKECIAAWGFYLKDRKQWLKEEKEEKKTGCNCKSNMASRVEAIWNCKLHGNCWNGVKWNDTKKIYEKV